MVQIVVSTSIVDDVRAMLAERGGPVAPEIRFVAVEADGTGADLADADAGSRTDLNGDGFERLLAEAPKLRWIHSPGAGVESFPLDELAAREIVLTNGAGVFAIPIAEWVLTTMLTIVKNSYAVMDAQRARTWARDLPADELYGKTVLVLGAGGIGREVIKRAAAFQMRVLASNRSGRSVEGAERTLVGDEWRDALPEADFIVSTLPLTHATRSIIGAAELSRLRAGAWLLNVGRGATIDEAALVDALRGGRIGGAALDAWTTEPLPAGDPAWGAPNMIVSPHMSGSSAAGRTRGLNLFVDNAMRFAAGDDLTNVVDLAAGY